MKKHEKTMILAVTIFCIFLVVLGCGTKEENSKTTSADKGEVSSIKETKLENYEVNKISGYALHTSIAGFALKFDVKFDNMSPAYEAYVCNDMSSLFDIKIQEENDKRLEEVRKNNPDISDEKLYTEDSYLWYESVFSTSVVYAAGENVEIEWAPHPTAENSSKYSAEEEFLKTGYMYLVLKEGENITGFMVFEFPVNTTDEEGLITYDKINVVEAVAFEKIDGEYQNVSHDYVKTRVDEILKNIGWY